jgi:hypothetical protein
MGQDVAAAPEYLIVWMGNDYCGLLAKNGFQLIEVDDVHCFPRKASKCR